MAAKTIECAECGEPVPSGRLACPSCGALLATVAGATKPRSRSAASNGSRQSAKSAPAARATEPAPAAAAEPVVEAAPEPAAVPPVEPSPEPAAPRERRPLDAVIPVAPSPAAPPAPGYLIEPATDAPAPAAYLLEPQPLAHDSADDDASPWPPLLEPQPGTLAQRSTWGGAPAPSPARPVPGAYVPPAATPQPVSWPPPRDTMPVPSSGRPAMRPTTVSMAGATATAGAGVGMTAGGGVTAAGATAAGATAVAARPAANGSRIGLHSIGLDRAKLTEIANWMVAAGSAVAILGFFLPWSLVVIGARGTGGYLDNWGLASPSHIFVLVALLVVLGLGVVQNGAPAWLRTGVLGLVIGGLLLGLTWPYTIGPLGANVGALAAMLGGVMLVVGGVLASWSTRHEVVAPDV